MLPKDWYAMTFTEHILAYRGHEEEINTQFSMHRRTAYEVYLSRPKGKGSIPVSIERFMPLPIDGVRRNRPAELIKTVHSLFLEKLVKEKSNG